jgi:hypothetical protein
MIQAGRRQSDHIDLVLAWGTDQQVGDDIAAVQSVRPWQQVACG